ncbi:MAG: ABC transporter substrate-binding protein [Candidatus Cloacimonetes bacterium]|nr:ABC transporter substrate-binding protein [Candidatus Cloacimonadota bacterium]
MTKFYAFIFLCFTGLLYSNQAIQLRLKWYHQLQFIGYYQALEQGYYKDSGFDVTLLEGNETDYSISVVLDGKADFGVGSTKVLHSYLKGKNPVLVSTIFQYNPLVLVSNSKKIQTIKDFDKTSLMIDAKEFGSTSILSMLAENGVSLDSINSVPFDYQKLLKLDTTNIDGFGLYITELPRLQQFYSNKLKVFNPIAYGSNEYGDFLFTSKSFVQKYPEQVQKFKDASIKGWKFALSNPQNSIQLFLNKYGSKLSKDELNEQFEVLRSLIQNRLIPIGYSNEKRWNKVVDSFFDLNIISKPRRDLKSFFNVSNENKMQIYDVILIFVILLLLYFLVKQFYGFIYSIVKTRRKLQLELNIAQDHLSSLQNFASIRTWSYQVESDKLNFSPGFFEMLGWPDPIEKLTFQESLKFVHPDDHNKFTTTFNELCKLGVSFETSIKTLYINDDIRYFSVSGYVDQVSNEKIVKVQGEIQDVTEFVLQRHKLGLTRYSIDSSSELMIWLNKSGTIIDLNEAVCDFFEMNKEHLLGKPLSSVYTSLSHKTLLSNLEMIYEVGFLKKDLDIVVGKKTENFELLANSVQYLEDDYIFISLRNMHERKRYEKTLVQSKKQAEAAELFKRNLIATMSHEFHAPMAKIVNLSSQLSDSSIAEQDTFVNEIVKSSSELLELLSETLVYSSIATNEDKYTDFDISEMLEIACLEMYESIKASTLKIEYNSSDDVPRTVSLDIPLFEILVKNLLDNSIQYSTEGVIKVDLSFCDLIDTFGSPYLILSIKDEGCGISEEHQDRIFEPFYQVSAMDHKQRTGMGLAVCNKIIEAFHGSISVRSKIGKGSEFVCLIPVTKHSL